MVLKPSCFTRDHLVTSEPSWNNFHGNLWNFSPRQTPAEVQENFWLFNDQRKLNENIVVWRAEAKMEKKKKAEKAFSALFSCQWTELYLCVCEIATMVLFWLMLDTEHSAAQHCEYLKGSK